MQKTTRRGFFGVLAGALASVPVLKRFAPTGSAYVPVECGYALVSGALYRYSSMEGATYIFTEPVGQVEIGDMVTFDAAGRVTRAANQTAAWGTATHVDGPNVLVRPL